LDGGTFRERARCHRQWLAGQDQQLSPRERRVVHRRPVSGRRRLLWAFEDHERIREQEVAAAVVGMKIDLQPRVAVDAGRPGSVISRNVRVGPEPTVRLTRIALASHEGLAMAHVGWDVATSA